MTVIIPALTDNPPATKVTLKDPPKMWAPGDYEPMSAIPPNHHFTRSRSSRGESVTYWQDDEVMAAFAIGSVYPVNAMSTCCPEKLAQLVVCLAVGGLTSYD